MRRLVLVLVLLLLPLQASWAAVAAYCGHENGVASKHMGHHQHKHQAGAGDQANEAAPATGGMDRDCGTCHINLNLAVFSVDATLLDDGRSLGQFPPSRLYASHVPIGPERPNWRFLA